MNQSIFVINWSASFWYIFALLQSARLDMWIKLGPGNGNVRGFFESLDFVELHEMILRSKD